MLVLEDLIAKMKVHFPKWMDIRRKVKTSSGGKLLYSIAEEITEIQDAIKDYRKDFFIDNYIGNEDEVLTYLYKYQIGIVDISSLTITFPSYEITEDEKTFYSNDGYAYYSEGSIYLKENAVELEYFIDNYKSIATPEKIHVWNVFDEFAAFVGLRRFQWESNRELLNRILSSANNKVNSTHDGLKNAILNNLVNIDNSITYDDILIERPTPENLNKYYDDFEIILDHLATINRDVYRTKRWDLDTWNFDIKSVDYIPHAWDIALTYYSNGIGFDDDLKVEIIDSDMKTDATIYFYKKTLEYINSYIKNNNIKETVHLDLVKHNDELVPENVKYRITATELERLDVNNITAECYDYKIGEVHQTVDDIFDEQIQGYNNVDIIDNRILDHNKKYVLRFKSLEELKEMSIDKLSILNTKTNKTRNIMIEKPGFEYGLNGSVKCSLTKKYLSEKYHYSYIENAHKEVDGFVISNVQEPTKMKALLEACQNEEIYYNYYCEQVPVLFHNISMVNCYAQNDSILSDTVNGEKYIQISMNANTFSCNVHGPHKIIYSIDGATPKTLTQEVDDTYDFKIKGYDKPVNMNIKIILNPINNMQCAITDIMYSKYEFEITTEKGQLVEIAGQKRLPNHMNNKLVITMKTYTGFSPVLEYVYIGTKLQNIIYGDIEITPEEGDMLLIEKSNCIAELETHIEYKNNDWRLDFVDYDYIASKVIVGKSNESYIYIDLSNFKDYKSVFAERCTFEAITQGSVTKHMIRIPAGVYLKEIFIVGEYEKLVFKETLALVLERKGYSFDNYEFKVAKTNDNIIATDLMYGKVSFLKIKRTDLIASSAAKIKFNIGRSNIQSVFIENDENKVSSISNEHEGNFNFISFYPTATKIYKAINECNVISPKTIVPQIINTFDNDYVIYSENSLYYTIETLNSEYDVKFIKNNKSSNYSVDSSQIIITKNNTDNLLFNFDSLTVTYESLIGNTVEIPEMFTVNRDKIEVAKYVIANEDLEILYLNKYNDNLHERDYIVTEIFTISDLMCTKLKYCNINEIESITDYITEEHIDESRYKLLSKEGVLQWFDTTNISEKIVITYNINKPKYIKLSLDQLYQKVNFSTNAYELLNKVNIYEIGNNNSFNLSMYQEYEESDLISVKCSNIGFEANVSGNVLSFEKNLKNNTIAVKSGYYYLDGDEYYLFADENRNNIEQMDNLFFFNVIKENKKLYFNQTTSNMVANSALKTNANGTVFCLDCQDKNIEGISKINSITTCENFNYWKSVGMNMSVAKGLNGLGIQFTNIASFEGYSYLDISKHIPSDGKIYTISFYMKGSGSAYLGQEDKMKSESNEFNKQSIIEVKTQAAKSLIEDDIYEIEFTNNYRNKYYLIVKGNVLIDDIIIQTKEEYNIDYHIKNISYLNLDIKETIYANFKTRLYLNDVEGAIFDGTEVKDEYIVNSSYIDWGFTKYKELNTYDDFRRCTLDNVDLIQHNDKCYVKTGFNKGKITTESIYIGNIKTIKNLLFKVNDVMFESMKGFKVRVLTSSNGITGFKEIDSFLDNISSINIDKLESYVKLIVEMPSKRVINNIELFIEYLSDDIHNPPEIPVISGSYTSKVLDAQYNTRFLVKNLGFELDKTKMSNVEFLIRASKENAANTVWTDWKTIVFEQNTDGKYYLDSRIVFDDYRYFQFKVNLKGEGSSVKIKNLDLEVI